MKKNLPCSRTGTAFQGKEENHQPRRTDARRDRLTKAREKRCLRNSIPQVLHKNQNGCWEWIGVLNKMDTVVFHTTARSIRNDNRFTIVL